MPDQFSNQKMTENEAVFRTHNERALNNLESMNDEVEGITASQKELKLHFYCECADEDCRNRIPLKPSDYKKHHESRDNFIVLPSHEIESIEDIIIKRKNYLVVKKHEKPPEKSKKLNPTPARNN